MDYKYECKATLDSYTLTKEEKEACLELISKMRAERAKKRAIEEHREILRLVLFLLLTRSV